MATAERVKFYVYIIFDPEDGVPRYVGKGSGRRVLDHYERKRVHNARLRMLTQKEKREYIVIDAASEQAAFAMEIFWIAVFGRLDLQTGTLFNLTCGGDGPKWNQPQKDRQSKLTAEQWKDPEFRATRSASQKKSQSNPEVRAKISASQKGISRYHRSKKCSIDDGMTVYNSFNDLRRATGITRWKALHHPQFLWLSV